MQDQRRDVTRKAKHSLAPVRQGSDECATCAHVRKSSTNTRRATPIEGTSDEAGNERLKPRLAPKASTDLGNIPINFRNLTVCLIGQRDA